jgi:hypothetical protein
MKTRSQTKKEGELKEVKQLYEVNIDFDEASRAWHSNKKSVGNGHYKYICTIEKNGSTCGKSCYKDLLYCWIHRNGKK